MASGRLEGRRRSWRTASVVVFTFLVSAVALPEAVPAPQPSVAAYRGLGTWVDRFDDAQWDDPEGTVQAMQALGVRTLFLQTSNYRTDYALFRPARMERFIRAAHVAGMRVVGWYLPGFDNLRRDYRRSMAAINFRTSDGQAFDSFGLDIESREVTDVTERNARLLRLSRRIRDAVGSSYPLGAIIPAPRDLELPEVVDLLDDQRVGDPPAVPVGDGHFSSLDRVGALGKVDVERVLANNYWKDFWQSINNKVGAFAACFECFYVCPPGERDFRRIIRIPYRRRDLPPRSIRREGGSWRSGSARTASRLRPGRGSRGVRRGPIIHSRSASSASGSSTG